MNYRRVQSNSFSVRQFLQTIDPKIFKSKANNDYISTNEEKVTQMAFYSQKSKQMKKGDLKKEFYSIGMDVNLDGKMQYYNAIN